MASYDIVIDDRKVRINHINTDDKQSFPRTGYRIEQRNDSILILEAGTGVQVFRIDSADDLNSITDNRTTAGVTTPISTIDEIYSIIDDSTTPYFFTGAANIEVTLDSIELNTDDLERDVWDQIPGNSSEYTYYTGVEAPAGNFGNPSGTTSNVKIITYKTGVTAIYYRDLAWDANDNILKITARV
jgi:hypothetical protein